MEDITYPVKLAMKCRDGKCNEIYFIICKNPSTFYRAVTKIGLCRECVSRRFFREVQSAHKK